MVSKDSRCSSAFLRNEFSCEGRWNFAIVKKQQIDLNGLDLIAFSDTKPHDNHNTHKGVHFFVDDYRFERVWQNWKRYGEQLKRFHSVMTPDFSMFTDYPTALQLWNHYRKQFIGAYLQTLGCKVYPTICWSDEKSYAFCFDGVPVGGCVCVSSVGTQKHHESKRLFSIGYSAMLERLQPETVIFYGDIPKECKGNIVHILAFQEKFKVVKNGDFS